MKFLVLLAKTPQKEREAKSELMLLPQLVNIPVQGPVSGRFPLPIFLAVSGGMRELNLQSESGQCR